MYEMKHSVQSNFPQRNIDEVKMMWHPLSKETKVFSLMQSIEPFTSEHLGTLTPPFARIWVKKDCISLVSY